MEITKARLKQIIMEEIQKFIVAEEDDITPEEEEAAKEILKSAEDEDDPEKAVALARQAADSLSSEE